MAETELHVLEMLRLIEILRDRYRDKDNVYVAGNMFVYYEKGNPEAQFSPDVFVVFGVHNRMRRTYKLWEEKQPPAVVFEITSRKTWLEDAGNKKTLCARLGVSEYFTYDPEGEYLDPPLKGFRLEGSEYHPMMPDAGGDLTSRALGLKLRLERSRLRLIDLASGKPLLRMEEARQQGRLAAERAAGAEAEIERLRSEIEHLKDKRK